MSIELTVKVADLKNKLDDALIRIAKLEEFYKSEKPLEESPKRKRRSRNENE